MKDLNPSAIVNSDSEIIVCNETMSNYMGLKNAHNARGLHYSEQQYDARLFANEFVKQDQIALKEKRMFEFISCFKYGDNQYHSLIGRKKPIIYQGKLSVHATFFEVSDQVYRFMIDKLLTNSSRQSESDFENVWCEIKNPYIACSENKNIKGKRRFDMDNKELELSLSEIKILQFLVTGMSNKEIASHSQFTKRTVDDYVEKIRHKLKCRNKSELIATAYKSGLVYALTWQELDK